MKLYDYVFNIINKKKPFHLFNETEVKGFDKFMVNKVLSMDYNLLKLANENNSILNEIPDDVFHDSLQNYIPYRKYDLKYRKKKSEMEENKKQIINIIADYYEVPIRDAEMYYYDLTDEQKKSIMGEYGL